jgi:hypothetical protein
MKGVAPPFNRGDELQIMPRKTQTIKKARSQGATAERDSRHNSNVGAVAYHASA